MYHRSAVWLRPTIEIHDHDQGFLALIYHLPSPVILAKLQIFAVNVLVTLCRARAVSVRDVRGRSLILHVEGFPNADNI